MAIAATDWTWLKQLASSAPAPVYSLGVGPERSVGRRLLCEPGLEVARSPRHASVLVVAGPLPEPTHTAAKLVHDQIPHPRAVVVCDAASHSDAPLPFPDPARTGPEELPSTIRRVFEALHHGERDSSEPLLPGRNPVSWRGVGPHGHGGKGMMGGKPYGRSMAMTGDDIRDGLMLDRVEFVVGPFLWWMPAGLELKVQMQGDVIQSLEPRVPGGPPASPPRHQGLPTDLPAVFVRARDERVAVADLERARAQHHLEATADFLVLHGLRQLARRALHATTPAQVDALRSSLRRSLSLTASARGIGQLEGGQLHDPDQLAGLGAVARAAGDPRDARTEDPAYEGLGFEPIAGGTENQEDGASDALGRVFQRLAEASQALELAERARASDDPMRQPGPPLEGPRGPIEFGDTDGGRRDMRGRRWQQILSQHAPGAAWEEFVTTLVSLDIDPALMPPSEDYGDARVGSFAISN